MRPIDTDELKKRLEAEHCDCEIVKLIDETPTIETEPVKRGRWIIGQCGKDKYIKCSVCKARIVDTIVSLEGDISQDYFVICPRCGARMKSNEQEEEHEHRKETDTP